MINAADIRSKIASANGTVSQIGDEPEAIVGKVRAVYRLAFSREATQQELSVAIAYLSESRFDAEGNPLSEAAARKESFQDLLWAIMNTKEFLFNH